MNIDANNIHYKQLNERIRSAIRSGEKEIILNNVNSQRYIGDGVTGTTKIIINGVPGNDLAAFMNGLTIIVNGNCQDATGNTMNSGKVIIKGDAGDVVAHSMRGGKIFITGNAGYRVGIHMKEYREHKPVIIIGGNVGDFFGEYMAGGILILLGLSAESDGDKYGDYLATGMHGGMIFIRAEKLDTRKCGPEVKIFETDEDDMKLLTPLLKEYCQDTGIDTGKVLKSRYLKLLPVSKNPYGNLYTHSL